MAPDGASFPIQSTSGTTAGAITLPVQILPQPDDASCGPTCLHAVYRFWGEDPTLASVIDSVRPIGDEAGRGTLAVMLGIDALQRGYRAHLDTFNLHVFDPTWFDAAGVSDSAHLTERLRAQAAARISTDERFPIATAAYLEFLERGGTIGFPDLSARLISRTLRRGVPILTGLSATYLYRCSRDDPTDATNDDLRGDAEGHFVIVHGYDPPHRLVDVADPLARRPGFEAHYYRVAMARLVPAIALGVLTYDANLLTIEPAPEPASPPAAPPAAPESAR